MLAIEWVDQWHAGLGEIRRVARDHCQSMAQRGRREQAVLDGHRRCLLFQARQKSRPFTCGRGIEIEDYETPDPPGEPLMQEAALAARGKEENSILDFTQDNRVHHDFGLMVAKPSNQIRFRERPGGFTEDVGIRQMFHSASVFFEEMGWK